MLIRCGGANKVINLKIFTGLLTELRIKLDITKAGLGPEKRMRVINYGLKLEHAAEEGPKDAAEE